MTNSFVEVEIIADRLLVEQLVGILSQLGFEGFWEDGSSLRCYISTSRWTPEMPDEVRSVANLIARSSTSAAPKITVRGIEDKNWNAEWEKTIKPIRVTERIVITPTWHRYEPSPGELVLTIDPKMSFGTGYHETTRLVLRLMEKHVKPGVTVLDIGTGTGVLAIAGLKLGASSAVGVDNDEWSFDNAQENARLNSVDEKIVILLGELRSVPLQKFGIIVANIQRNIIEPLLPEMQTYLAKGGTIILSGLLREDREPILSAISISQLKVDEELSENEWLAFAVRQVL